MNKYTLIVITPTHNVHLFLANIESKEPLMIGDHIHFKTHTYLIKNKCVDVNMNNTIPTSLLLEKIF